jgi:hypothetical protein
MSQNPSSGASPGNGPSVDSLVKTIDQIESQLKDYQQAQKKTGRIMALGSLAILVVMVLFMVNLYDTARTKFTEDKVRAALITAAQGLEPEIKVQITEAANEIIPLYIETAKDQMSKDWPAIQTKLSEKATKFPEQVQGMLVKDGQEMLNRVEKHLEKTIQKEFPGVTTENAHKLADSLISHTALKSEKLHERLATISKTEYDKLYKVMEKFPIGDYASLDRAALEKKVLRKVVQVVDYELEVHGTKEGLDLEELQKQGIIGTTLLGGNPAPAPAPAK